jgi:hypothetical protein
VPCPDHHMGEAFLAMAWCRLSSSTIIIFVLEPDKNTLSCGFQDLLILLVYKQFPI